MPKSKAEIMRDMRKARKDKRLVEFRRWCTPEIKEKLVKYADRVEKKG